MAPVSAARTMKFLYFMNASGWANAARVPRIEKALEKVVRAARNRIAFPAARPSRWGLGPAQPQQCGARRQSIGEVYVRGLWQPRVIYSRLLSRPPRPNVVRGNMHETPGAVEPD